MRISLIFKTWKATFVFDLNTHYRKQKKPTTNLQLLSNHSTYSIKSPQGTHNFQVSVSPDQCSDVVPFPHITMDDHLQRQRIIEFGIIQWFSLVVVADNFRIRKVSFSSKEEEFRVERIGILGYFLQRRPFMGEFEATYGICKKSLSQYFSRKYIFYGSGIFTDE